MADSKLLLDSLVAYQESLTQHLKILEGELDHLQKQWLLFSNVYEGDAAIQFRTHWQRTTTNFREYLERAERLKKLVDERIEHLLGLNQEAGRG